MSPLLAVCLCCVLSCVRLQLINRSPCTLGDTYLVRLEKAFCSALGAAHINCSTTATAQVLLNMLACCCCLLSSAAKLYSWLIKVSASSLLSFFRQLVSILSSRKQLGREPAEAQSDSCGAVRQTKKRAGRKAKAAAEVEHAAVVWTCIMAEGATHAVAGTSLHQVQAHPPVKKLTILQLEIAV